VAKKPDTLLVQDGIGNLTTIPGDTAEEILADRGWDVVEDENAVTRDRQKRPKGWYKQAIKDGVIADPEQGIPERVKSDNEHVVDVPTAVVKASPEG
jgi:hypothetical protein